ncbi:uncharacterized protein si:ch211-106e7.2 isoform X2 [Hippoglossus hippoglossus]|uniref:uncharacterized protein si:ch211-106e7.2 isoform X2 n=1 Tax=Hippoglossus hippoglossus TaxID=8267 RepID=UPI00148C156C|nr:uncharacterized protein si:ch211-106e7.2 isoform X2 [Hippoglossus hippoglossus]
MYYSTQMNGPYQPVGQPSQTVHAATPPTYDTMRNQQPGTANNSCSFWAVDPRIQTPQNGHVPFRDGTQPNRQMSNWQTSAAPHQASSSQSTAGMNDTNYVLYKKYPNLTGILGEVPSTPYQNPAQNSKMQTPPKMKTTHSQQNTTAYLIQPVTFHGNQSIRTQDVQNHGVQKNYQVVNGKVTNPCLTYITAATLVPCKQTVCTSTIQVTRPTANNQNSQQNVSRHRFPTSILPKYSEAISESLTHNSITTNPPPRGQIWGYSSMSQTTQQYTAQLNSTPNNAREATCRPTCSSIKSNELPLKATADAQQQMTNHNEETMIISRIAEGLRKSYQAEAVGRHPVNTNSTSTWQLIRPSSQVCEVGTMECHQTMQLGTSAADRSNSNATQRLQLISRQCLPQRVLSRPPHIVTSPQQRSAPDIYCVTTEDGITDGNKERNAFFPKNNSISTGNVVESSSAVSQFMQLPEAILLQRTETQLSVKNNHEMLCSVGKKDNSIQSSPSRTGTRAVAVVQPLLQKNYNVVKKQNSSNTIKQLEECTAKYASLRNPEKICTSPAVAKKSQVINLSEGLKKHLQDGPQYKTQNQSYAHEQGSELSSDRSVAPAVQQSVTSEGLEGQHRDMNKAEVPLDQNTCDFDLSSIPTTQWTTVNLINFTMDSDKAQSQDFKGLDSVQDVMRMFWRDKIDIFRNKIKSGWYRTLMDDVKTFCREHVTNDSVILSQVKGSYSRQLKKHHFLKHNEKYSEPPYQSSWLNVNEQVDDIDKEFGFSRTLRPHVSTLGSDSQPDEFGETSSISAHNLSDVSNKAFSQTELRSVDPGEGKQAPTVEITSSRISSPNETDPDSAHSNDQHYSFEIQVLSPEEAKVIFGQMQSKLPQSMDTQSQPENVTKSSVEDELPDFGQSVTKSSVENELPDVGDTLKDSKLESKKKISLIDEFCCLAGWIEKFFGKDTSLKCACKEKQDHKDCTEKTLDKETTVQNNNQPAIRLDNVHSAIETDHQMSAEENIDSQVVPCSSTDLCNDISQTIDLAEDEKRLRSHSAKETKNMSLSIIDDSQLSPLVLSDSEVEDVSCSGSEIPNQIRDNGIWMSDSEEKCVQEQLKSVGSGQSSPSDDSKGEFIKVVSIDLESHINTEVGCPQAQLTSTDVAESSLEVEEPTQTGPAAGLQTTSSQCDKLETVERKRKTLHNDEKMCQLLKNLKKRVNKKVSVNAAETKPLASKDKTVELVLFGSKRHDGEFTGSHAAHRPPNVVSVNLNPSKRKSSVPTPDYSVKGWIHEKWRTSYLPTTISHRKKLKTLPGTLPRTSLKKAETACPSKTEELPVCNEMKRKGNTNYCVNRKKRRLLSNRPKLGEESRRMDVGPLKPSDKERSDDGSHTHTRVGEKYVLKFSVLPNTFSFADGPNGRKQTTANVSGNSDAAGGDSPGKAITGARGTR